MFEPPSHISRRNLGKRIFQSGPQGAVRTGLEGAEKRLEFRNALFNRVKVWRVGRQILYARSGRCDQADRPRTIMELHIVQTHDVAPAQHWRDQLLNIEVKDLTVDRSFDGHRGHDPTQCEGADNRNALPIIERLQDDRSLSPWCPGMSAGHHRIDRKFVHNPQARGGPALLFCRKLRSCYWIRFAGPPRLFFRVRANAANQRQTVLMLTLTRFVFLSQSRSSSRVASGCCTTSS